MIHEEITHKVIGAAMEVHKHLGNGFQEVVYQRALAIEMNLQDIGFAREKEMPLLYKECPCYTKAMMWEPDGLIFLPQLMQ